MPFWICLQNQAIMVIVIDRETTSFLYPMHSWPRFEHHVVFLGQCKEIWPPQNLNNRGSEAAEKIYEAEKRHQKRFKWIEGWKKTTDARGYPTEKRKEGNGCTGEKKLFIALIMI